MNTSSQHRDYKAEIRVLLAEIQPRNCLEQNELAELNERFQVLDRIEGLLERIDAKLAAPANQTL